MTLVGTYEGRESTSFFASQRQDTQNMVTNTCNKGHGLSRVKGQWIQLPDFFLISKIIIHLVDVHF